jgi:hypothetical protein
MFWLLISFQKVNHMKKYVMNTFWHLNIKAQCCRTTLFQSSQAYNYFISLTNLGNISFENCFLKGKTNFRHKCKLNVSNCMGKWFLTINKPISSKKHFFLLHMIFLERFDSKKLTITLLDGFDIFLGSCLSIFSFNGLFPPQSFLQ